MKSMRQYGSGMTRRDFLKLTSGFTASLALTGFKPMSRGEWATSNLITQVNKLSLNGDEWSLGEENSTDKIHAIVPGTTYGDLLRNGRLPDPYFRENNDKVQWVAQKDWIYEREFEVDQSLLSNEHADLVCHGLDTLATIWINGQQVAVTNNMFRTWIVGVKKHLKVGSNTIRIRFKQLGPYIKSHEEAYKKQHGVDLKEARSWVRKGPYMWGWDWCRPILTMGIWKDIELLAYDARISNVGVFQKHRSSGEVNLNIVTEIEGARDKNLQANVTVTLDGKKVADWTENVSGSRSEADIEIKNPELWWPNGMGKQPLYQVEVKLQDLNGTVLDTHRDRVGLRTIEVHAPNDGVAMHISVNGKAVFAKGANWIPADNIPTRVTPEILNSYIKDAADCNFNFIRLWGGGYYEEDALFDACDELGIMLQFEFKFANTAYPIHDENWIRNLEAEVEDQVLRCRNHPSIVIWSGNNEIQNFDGYNYLFDDVIGGKVRKLIPNAFYEVGSGAEGSGDIHAWNIWHGMKPFDDYFNIHGFVTEFGMQSFTCPMTVMSYTDPGDRTSVHSEVIGYHEMSYGPKGIGRITKYITDNFGSLPADFDSVLWLSQIMQAWGIRMGVEHWRREMPKSMAAAIWQMNDCWPGPTWSMIDWYHRWKALQYQSRHFFAPVMVSGVANSDTGKVDLYVVNDKIEDVSGGISYVVTDMDGMVLGKELKDYEVKSGTSKLVRSVDLSNLVRAHNSSNLIVWIKATYGNDEESSNVVLFKSPKELNLRKPDLAVEIDGSDTTYRVTLKAKRPALWVWLDLDNMDARFSDNFIHLRPETQYVINIALENSVSMKELRKRLNVHSVYEVAPSMRA